MAATRYSFSPRDGREAAEILGACSGRAESGRNVRVGLVESPFRPAVQAGIPAAQGAGPVAQTGPRAACVEPSAASVPWRGIEALGGVGDVLVFLDHSSMAAIHEISKNDFLIVAGGGARLADVIAAAREAGLFFPHEPDSLMGDATIAEIIMDGSVFKTEGRFGGLREYVLGLELATPGGEIIRTGSRSVKDVTGYDTAGFLMGSGARCGMIVRATLRLLPARGTRFPFACAGDAVSVEKLAALIHTRIDAAFLEIFDDEAARLLGARFEGALPRGANAAPRSPEDSGAPGDPGAGSARAAFSASPALLVGELLASEPGGERELFDRAREIAPPGLSLRGLDDAALDAYRRFPALVLDASGGESLYHLSHDCRPMTARHLRAYNSMSLYPGRRHSYFPCNDLPADFAAMVLESGERARMEIIEKRVGGIFRRRIGEGSLRRLAGGRSAPGVSAEDEKARDAETELAERIFRVFDPRMIMIP